MDSYIPPANRRDPKQISSYRPSIKTLGCYDDFIRLGNQRATMSKNPIIVKPHMEAGEQMPPMGPIPPKSHVYGLYKTKAKYDNVKSAIDDWQSFNTDKQLKLFERYHRRRDTVTANTRALDAKLHTPKEWNRFVLQQKDLWCYLPPRTQESYKLAHTYRVPEDVDKRLLPGEDIYRVLAHDYGREWFRLHYATSNHETALNQIDQRMLGAKFNSIRAGYYTKGQHVLKKRLMSRVGHNMLPLPAIKPPARIKNAQTKLNTFRDGDLKQKNWHISQPDRSQWHSAAPVRQ
ncbi:uncharacterized protein LOC129585774 [Paramacrobiotus metropolitanus]|uniref:uncharacterized protein LOC129585774 n=1 Tax=Paramacrobiotus metropolitanus TaxID=2943436 RepID=UPI0024457B82|nr:uncharacterized protein LOC129585774 [Paramacrobiotus metropolitanus]